MSLLELARDLVTGAAASLLRRVADRLERKPAPKVERAPAPTVTRIPGSSVLTKEALEMLAIDEPPLMYKGSQRIPLEGSLEHRIRAERERMG